MCPPTASGMWGRSSPSAPRWWRAGDPKGQGWVSWVVGRTQHLDLELTAYNLGVRGDTSADVLNRWRNECPPRWAGRLEKRLVVSVGDERRGHRRDARAAPAQPRQHPRRRRQHRDRHLRRQPAAVRRPRPQQAASRCSSRRRPTSAPAAECRSSTASGRCWATSSGSPTLAASKVPDHPGQAGYGLVAWLVLYNGWYDWLQISG